MLGVRVGPQKWVISSLQIEQELATTLKLLTNVCSNGYRA